LKKASAVPCPTHVAIASAVIHVYVGPWAMLENSLRFFPRPLAPPATVAQVTEVDFADMFGSFDLTFKEGNAYS
jgi:hypothetical protein